MRENLVVMSAYVRPSVRTDSGGGGGESQDNPTGSSEYHFFLSGKLHGAFGQPAFFLAGSGMTTVAFEKKGN